MPKHISLVVPFFNESEGVDRFDQAIHPVLEALSAYVFEIICVDDGSQDDTLPRLLACKNRDSRFIVLELSRNFGKESAMTAGLHMATGDAAIVLDADLQDPPELIARMLALWESSGADMVLAKRADRSSDGWFKRVGALGFYKLHNRLAMVPLPENVGDCRLMARPVLEALKTLPERTRFMKGLFAWVGFKTVTLEYTRPVRAEGASKFSGWKLWNLALDGISSFSTVPLRIWTYLGALGALLTACYAVFIVIRTLAHGADVPGYASLLVAILFFGSVQLISVGVLGEYIGRIHEETKQRPVYLLRAVHRQDSVVEPITKA
jgi:glycosyltransferase involved in cell wall biosynthesis